MLLEGKTAIVTGASGGIGKLKRQVEKQKFSVPMLQILKNVML